MQAHYSPSERPVGAADGRAPLVDGHAIPPDSWWTGLTCLVSAAVLTGVAVASLGGFLAQTIGTVAAIFYVVALSFAGPMVLRRWTTMPVWRWLARGAGLGGILGILALPIMLAM